VTKIPYIDPNFLTKRPYIIPPPLTKTADPVWPANGTDSLASRRIGNQFKLLAGQ